MKKLLLFIILFTACLQLQAVPEWSGSGTQVDPYLIYTVRDFCLLEADAGSEYAMDGGVWFKLMADIDLTDTMATLGYWTTIDGSGAETWRNHLDGNGFTVTGLSLSRDINAIAQQRPCLFYSLGYPTTPSTADTSNPIVYNITFDSVKIGGTWDIVSTQDIIFGILAGAVSAGDVSYSGPMVDSVVISNVYVDPTKPILWTDVDEAAFGGAIGIVSNGAKVSRIKVQGDIRVEMNVADAWGTSYRSGIIGGVIGALYKGATLDPVADQCTFQGRLEGVEGASNGGIAVGGIAGSNRYGVQITDSYVEGKVFATQNGGTNSVNAVGGIYGWSQNVAGTASNTDMYGVFVAGDSINDYTGGTDYAGLIYGYAEYGPVVRNTFADTTLSDLNTLAGNSVNTEDFGGDVPYSQGGQSSTQIPKTTALMKTQSTFTTADPVGDGYAMNFTTTWEIIGTEYPSLQFEASTAAITINSPANGSNNIYPFSVNWSGEDSVYIYLNGVLSDSVDADTTYSITTGPNGALPIKIVSRLNSGISDSISVNALAAGILILDSAYVTGGTTLNYEVRLGNIIAADSGIVFYVGQDTISMFTVGTIVAPSGYKDTTYTFTKPAAFYASGTVWYKIATSEDSVDNYVDPTINFVGQIGGVLICWYPQQNYPIETLGIRDLSCGWVGGIEKTYTSSRLNIPQTGLPTFTFFNNACPAPYTGCTWAQATFQAQDTTGGGTAVTVEKYSQTPAYLNTGATITVNSRRYYIFSESLYMDDVLNGVDSTVIADLSTYFDSGALINPSLWYFPYRTGITDTIQHDGTIDTELPARDTTLITIYEPSGFQRLYSFNALVTPEVYGEVLSDTFMATESVSASRDYFRGIDPKFIREPQ